MKKIASFLIATCMAGCAHQTEFPKYSTLVGRGILPLSTSDAYLGANLFVADEASHSTQLFNFLAGRGGPTAIELDEEGSAPPHMLMFYPRDKEVFAAELVQMPKENNGTYREWLVRGPYAIERKDFKELAHLESAFAGEPLFMIEGRAQRFRFQQPETVPAQGFKTVLVPVLPTPKPTPTPKRSIKVITVKKDEKPTIEDYKPCEQ